MRASKKPRHPSDVARRASESGGELLRLGLTIGAVGVAGAALGAVCPLCVVTTPALLGAGALQKLRSRFLARQQRLAEAEPTP